MLQGETRRQVILHIDMDCFFVSVERLFDSSLCGKAVAVATDSRRSVIASASYEARKYGVRSAMAVTAAKSRCPQLILVNPCMARYQEVSQRVFEIFERFTPYVERLGIDEGFLEVAGSFKLFGNARTIAEKIRAAVRQELGVPCSVGIGPNKFIAKIASVKAKPDGIFEVPHDRVLEFLHPLPVSEVYGVGPKTAKKLSARALHTVADVYEQSLEALVRLTGKAMGNQLYHLARGIDTRQIETDKQPKTLSNESTFDFDTDDIEDIKKAIAYLAQKVAKRLRQAGLEAGALGVNVRWSDFTGDESNKRLASATSTTTVIYQEAMQLLTPLLRGRKVRLLGIRAGRLSQTGSEESTLWEVADTRWQQIDRAADLVQQRFGGVELINGRLLQRVSERRGRVEREDARQLFSAAELAKTRIKNSDVQAVSHPPEKRTRQTNSFGDNGHAGGFMVY